MRRGSGRGNFGGGAAAARQVFRFPHRGAAAVSFQPRWTSLVDLIAKLKDEMASLKNQIKSNQIDGYNTAGEVKSTDCEENPAEGKFTGDEESPVEENTAEEKFTVGEENPAEGKFTGIEENPVQRKFTAGEENLLEESQWNMKLFGGIILIIPFVFFMVNRK